MRRLNSFMMLQYMEPSAASHLMVVPNKPKIPDPKIPPPLLPLPFAIIRVLVIQYVDKQNVIPEINTNKKN